MTAVRPATRVPDRIPRNLQPLFWDYELPQLRWESDRDLIVGRILSVGDWEAVRWLLDHLGRDGLLQWIEQREGRGLEPEQLRFWELALGLPHRQVTAWIRAGDGVWARRTGT